MIKKITTITTNILFVLIGFSLLVAFHEFGHLLAGIIVGAPITDFSIGFGTPLLTITGFNIDWHFSMIPLGGYVEFDNEFLNLTHFSGLELNFIYFLGPLFSLCLSFLIFGYLKYFVKGNNDPKINNPFVGPMGVFYDLIFNLQHSKIAFFNSIGWISLSLAILNILPIYPLDGGRILEVFFNTTFSNYPELSENFKTFSMISLMLIVFYILGKDIITSFKVKKEINTENRQYFEDLSYIISIRYFQDIKVIGLTFDEKEYSDFFKNLQTMEDIERYLGKSYIMNGNLTNYSNHLIDFYNLRKNK